MQIRVFLPSLIQAALAACIIACSAGGGGGSNGMDTAPEITTQPISQTVAVGGNATFTVETSGTPAPTFTWERSDDAGATWSPISHATRATHTFTVAKTDDDARFRAKATNSVDTAISHAATLTAHWAPVFITQPVDQAVTSPAAATFTVAVDANPAATLQWQSCIDGSTWGDLPGATGNSYATGATSTSDSGTQFHCLATNAVGIADSNAATLTVNAMGLPTISGFCGAGATLDYNDGGAKTAMADGTGAYSFTVPCHWSGTVTPSKAGCTFIPATRTYVNVTANQTGQDYTATPVAGGLAVTITGLTDMDADVTIVGPGAYRSHLTATETLTGLADGTYTLTAATVTDPTQPGLGRSNGGTLGPEHLQRYPLIPVQTVIVSGGVGTATVDYPPATLTVQITRKDPPHTPVPMEFILVPAGPFAMGSTAAEDSYGMSAHPRHVVTIREAFYVAKTELTQAQWKAVTGDTGNPSQFTGDTRPVDQASWDALRASDTGFLVQLNTALPNYGFRLPSEAEWEYACRAGTSTAYFFGVDATSLSTYAWWSDNSFNDQTRAVGTRAPNPWGLCDMAGNVWEWCEDDSHIDYYGAPMNGGAWVDAPRGGCRMLRGGSWAPWSPYIEERYRSAHRINLAPDTRNHGIGFRVVMPVPDSSAGALTFTLPGSVSLELQPIPAGIFAMGSPITEQDRGDTGEDQHPITLSALLMAKPECTQAQWQAVMGSNPSYFSIAGGGSSTDDPARPVERVSYNDITAAGGFLDRLNAATAAARPAGLVFRLATEAEWEYAARAGTTTRFYWGDDPAYTSITDYAWNFDNSGASGGNGTTHPAGLKPSNPWGLFDMIGNVWEWCQDWYSDYGSQAQTNPAGPANGSWRVLRGGGFLDSSPWVLRSAFRGIYDPASGDKSFGFRVVLAEPRSPLAASINRSTSAISPARIRAMTPPEPP